MSVDPLGPARAAEHVWRVAEFVVVAAIGMWGGWWAWTHPDPPTPRSPARTTVTVHRPLPIPRPPYDWAEEDDEMSEWVRRW